MAPVAVVDLGSTSLKYGLVDKETDKLLFCKETPTRAWEGAPMVLERVIELLRPYEFAGLGFCSGGQIDSKSGRVVFASENLPGYTGMAVGDLLRNSFPVPVAVMNDVNAAAVGESAFGAAQGLSDFLCVTFGTGVGGASVIGGKLYEGSHSGAGEFGHFVTHRGGLPCTCGNQGCYETYASTTALVKSATEHYGRQVDGRELFDFLRQGQAGARAIIMDWLEEMSLGLAGLIHIFNPQAIVLGGGIMQEPYVLEELPPLVRKNLMPSYRQTKLLPAKLRNTAGMLGMYYMVKHVL
ncbi:MAG: ROK family protein [Lachnospiraceae bacterium]